MLWSEILQVAEVFSVPHVAHVLRLKPQALKRRRGERVTTASAAAPQFVEVTPAVGQGGAVAVAVQRPEGARLRIPYRESSPAVAPLLQTCWEGR